MLNEVLVTGCAGFIGYRLSLDLLEEGHKVIGLDALSDLVYSKEIKRIRLEHLESHPHFSFLGLDISDATALEEVPTVSSVVNLAAIPGLMPSWSNARAYYLSNALGALNLARWCSNRDVRLVHISTSSVYGRERRGGNQRLEPVSPYGVSKLAGEIGVSAVARELPLDFSILRLFSVYGPGQRPDMAYSIFIRRLAEGKAIQVHGDGKQSRMNTYVNDVSHIVRLEMARPGRGRTLDVCGGESLTLLESIDIIASTLGVKPDIEFQPRRLGDQQATACNRELLQEEYGWSGWTSVAEGLRQQVLSDARS